MKSVVLKLFVSLKLVQSYTIYVNFLFQTLILPSLNLGSECTDKVERVDLV